MGAGKWVCFLPAAGTPGRDTAHLSETSDNQILSSENLVQKQSLGIFHGGPPDPQQPLHPTPQTQTPGPPDPRTVPSMVSVTWAGAGVRSGGRGAGWGEGAGLYRLGAGFSRNEEEGRGGTPREGLTWNPPSIQGEYGRGTPLPSAVVSQNNFHRKRIGGERVGGRISPLPLGRGGGWSGIPLPPPSGAHKPLAGGRRCKPQRQRPAAGRSLLNPTTLIFLGQCTLF